MNRPSQQTLNCLLATASCITLAAAFLTWSFFALDDALIEQRQSSNNVSTLEQKWQQANSETVEVARHLPLFEQLNARSLAQPANPASWGKHLLALQQELQLPELRYTFSPANQGIVPADANFRLFTTALQLHLGLIHEEDLLRFLDLLTERSPTMSRIDHCRLWRASQPALMAECRIELLRLGPRPQ